MRSSLRSPSQVEGTQNLLPHLEKELEIPPQRVLRPDSPAVTREQCRAPPSHSNGDCTSLGPHERLPDFSVITGKKSHTSCSSSRKTMRFPRPREMRPFFPAAPRKQSRVPSQNSIGDLTPFMQLKGSQRSPSPLEMKPKFPTTSREEPCVSHLIWR